MKSSSKKSLSLMRNPFSLGSFKSIVAEIKMDIARFRRQKRFISWHESTAFAGELGLVVTKIEAQLLLHSPHEAIQVLDQFLALSAHTIEHVDDSNGTIGDVFR